MPLESAYILMQNQERRSGAHARNDLATEDALSNFLPPLPLIGSGVPVQN